MKIFFILLTCLGFSCTSAQHAEYKPRNVEEYYVPTGIEKYFLTDIPTWANFDQHASCFKKSNIRYFDIDSLMKSYGISFEKAIQIQASFNDEFNKYKKDNSNKNITQKDEELLFYKVSERVGAKIIFFDPPKFKRIHFIWLDEILDNSLKQKKLENLLSSKVMDQGVPVLISLCLTRSDLESLYPKLNVAAITAELFSIYRPDGTKTPGFRFNLENFFNANQELIFYSQSLKFPSEAIVGKYKTNTY